MHCIHCGTKIADNAKYCNYCGKPLEDYSDLDVNKADTEQTFSQSVTTSTKWKKLLWKPAVILIATFSLIVWVIVSSDETSTSNSSSNSLVNVGKYSCTNYHASQVDSLAPNVDYSDEIAEWDQLGEEIENMQIDEYSEISVENYNQKVDQYKSWSDEIDNKIIATEGSIEEYNRTIDAYNTYLDQNCTKRRY